MQFFQGLKESGKQIQFGRISRAMPLASRRSVNELVAFGPSRSHDGPTSLLPLVPPSLESTHFMPILIFSELNDDRRSTAAWLCALAILLPVSFAWTAEPRVSSDAYHLELVATQPDIVTPIGMAFDARGRMLVVESHTHQRPKEYDGPAGDRIRMVADSNGDGRLEKWTTFAQGFTNAMNVLARPDGAVYVVTRQDVQLLRDTDGDGTSDESQTILRLDTADTYPHNGLEGIAIAPDGSLLVSMGENHGASFRLSGSDGITLEGQGEGGNLFQCSQEGFGLKRFANGFWNPFSICVTPGGRVFAADNDPDAAPPCRLLDVVWGGDYGFRFRYGRTGLHPLQAWNGELPGTLPMICGIGEAPTAIVLHKGRLWVTSWGDHRIEAYTLVSRGASFSAEREVVVQGEADFRPTGMAVAPDRSLYIGDWIRRDYGVHGQGRIWRLSQPADESPPPSTVDINKISPLQIGAADCDAALSSSDPFMHAAAVATLSNSDDLKSRIRTTPDDPRIRLGHLEAMRLKRAKKQCKDSGSRN